MPAVTVAATAGEILDYALAAFFIASGAGLLYLFIRMGGTFARLSSFLKGSERDLLPVIVKAGGTVDRVNDQLDKLDVVTDSAVSMADSADTAVRAVSTAITTPVPSGSHGGAVDHHRARAAHAVLAAEVRAGEAEIVAEEVGECLAHLDRSLVELPVHGDPDRAFLHRASPRARSTARPSARRVRTPATWVRYSAEACRSLSGRSPCCTRRPASSSAAAVGVPPISVLPAS